MHSKRVLAILKFLILGLAFLFILTLVGVNLPFSQQLITKKVNEFFCEKNLPVQVEKISLLINGKIGLDRVRILKNTRDTLVFAGQIRVSARVFPLLFRKVKVSSVTLRDAMVHITTDTLTGSPDLVALFSSGNKSPKPKQKSGKKWDIGIRAVSLHNIRFLYSDAHHGIQINQSIGSFYARFDKFSLMGRQLSAAFLELENVQGGITLNPSSPKPDRGKKSPTAWKFSLNQSDLKDILFRLDQPGRQQQIEVSLHRGAISDARFDMAQSGLSVNDLLLRKPGLTLLSSPSRPTPKSGVEDKDGTDFPGSWNILGRNLKITDGSACSRPYRDADRLPNEQGSFQITQLNTTLRDVRVSAKESGFTMDRLAFIMGNGFQLTRGNLVFNSDSTRISLLKATFRTESSRINLQVEARESLAALLQAYDSVPFSLQLEDTEISSRDMLTFLPTLKGRSSIKEQEHFWLGITCRINGSLDLLKIDQFRLLTPAGITLSTEGQVTGLKTPSSASFSLAFNTGTISRQQLDELLRLIGSEVNLPDFEPLTLKGRFSKRLMAPEFSLDLRGPSGNIMVDGFLELLEKNYQLRTAYSGIELGRLFEIPDMGDISGNFDLAGKGFAPDQMRIKADFAIDSAQYKGYQYNDIQVNLEGYQGHYSFSMHSADTSLACDLSGTADLNDSSVNAQTSGIFSLDAGRLGLLKGIYASGSLHTNLEHSSGGLTASVALKNLMLRKDNVAEVLESLTASFHSTDNLVTGRINTDFLGVDFHSSGSLDDIKNALADTSFRGMSLIDSVMENKLPYLSRLHDLHVSVKSSYDPFIGLLLSDSILSYHTMDINLIKDTAGMTLADLQVDRLNIGRNSGFGTRVHFENHPNQSSLLVKADSIKLGSITLTGTDIGLDLSGDTASYRINTEDRNGRLLYDMAGTVYKRDQEYRMQSTQSAWIINGFAWTVSPGDFLVLEPRNSDLTADLHWKNDSRTIDLYGRKSEKLTLECRNIGLDLLLLPGMDLVGYAGELTGTIDYQNDNTYELGVQMDVRQLKIASQLLGNLNINGSYRSDTLGTIESDLVALLNDTSRFDLRVRLGQRADQKSIRTEFSHIPLNIFEPQVRKYIRGLQGEVSGDLVLTSPGDNPQLNGSMEIKKTALKVVPLNARFYLPDDVIRLENNQLLFNRFTVLDSLNKRLILNGSIDLNDLTNITADLQVSSDRLQVMNTTIKDNPAFYGSVFVDSRLSITGTVLNPSLTGSIVLANGTVINYRYMEDLTVSETEKTITFARLTADQVPADRSAISSSASLTAPNIEASIEINPNSLFTFQISQGYDIGVQITGGGFLNYSLLPNKAINLNGTYEIQQGSSALKIPGWPRKNFIITAGSYLKWNGVVDDPELRLETTTKVRGSYYNPVDGKNREVDFVVFMKLANRLSQLEIVFDVGSNDQYITSVLNTYSREERMRQAINLLIFERIELPNMTSSTDYVTQQINKFWESQLNQFTKSTLKNVDLSFGIDTYTGVSEGGGEKEYTSFTYEVKKEMFNKRGSVMVSGRMNDNSQAGAPTSNMLENFIFEYALDTNRTKFVKVYRQQNYEDLLEGEVTKSGVGFIYRKSYDRLRDIWRRKNKKMEKGR
jgi:hypothetical protein